MAVANDPTTPELKAYQAARANADYVKTQTNDKGSIDRAEKAASEAQAKSDHALAEKGSAKIMSYFFGGKK